MYTPVEDKRFNKGERMQVDTDQGGGGGMNGNPKSPVSPTSNTTTRPIKVDDAMNYLDAVKYQFIEKPEVYNCFLNVMKDFKHGTIEASDVIKQVSRLFHGHPVLLEGFNQFLPAGHRIDPSTGAIQPPGR